MTWLKTSDTAAHHPVVLAALGMDVPDVRLTELDVANLLFGQFSRLAVQSAGYRTDYVVRRGVLVGTIGPNWRVWVDMAQRAGYLAPVVLDDGETAWRLLDDPSNLVHIRMRDEIEWEQQRKRDTATTSLTVPVRLRDGDGCRYCGRVVTWGDQRGGRGGTYDHRVPGQAAGGPDDLRVACRQCNARRGNAADADDRVPPLPAPAQPIYGPRTRQLLAEHGHRVPSPRATRSTSTGYRATAAAGAAGEPNTTGDPLARITPDPATPAQSGYRARTTTPRLDEPPSTTAPRDLATGQIPRQLATSQDHLALVNPANRGATGSGTPGRDGSGREARTVLTPSEGLPRRRRGRRGKRHQGPAQGATSHDQPSQP